MAQITLAGLGKAYADGTRAVTNLDLEVQDGEFLVLVGPSGCGKTTALRMIAGLEDISEGVIQIGDRVVNTVPARDRDVAMVFQSYALYPHLNVYDNISFGLTLRKMAKAEIKNRVTEVARILDLEAQLDRRPKNLSGGQRQRVAMGRAIVREPQVFLMDEPLSNLDAKLRVQMRAEIARIQRTLNVTTVYVTHDQTEAMTLGDRVAIMKRGVLQQVGSPHDLYDRPVNLFVAGFIGSPGMNLVNGWCEQGDDDVFRIKLGSSELVLPPNAIAQHSALRKYSRRQVVVGIRPEDMEDAALVGAEDGAVLDSVADLVEVMGSDVLVHFPLDTSPARTDDTRELVKDMGGVEASTEQDTAVVVARFSPRTTVFEGQQIKIRVDTSRLHFFDAETGMTIRNDE